MGLSLSNLGINMGTSMSTGGSTSGKVNDAERRRRLLAVLDTIGKKKGRLSRESIKRIGRRYDLVAEEAEPLKLSLAGKAGFVVDVHTRTSGCDNMILTTYLGMVRANTT